MVEPGVPACSLAALYDRISPAVEEAMVDAQKAVSLTIPTPPTDPFFGLDRGPGPSLRAIERLTAHGDFRKYVFVLDAGGGAGSFARWLTATYGCRVLVLDVLPRLLAVGRRFAKRAGLASRTTAVAGTLEAIPLRDGVFTQIWSVATLHHVGDRARALCELFRVLRPGSTLALHEIVRRSDAVAPIGDPWRHGTEAEYLELLASAGFVTIASSDVTDEAQEPSAVTRSAERAFFRLLSERDPPAAADWRARTHTLQRIHALERGPDYRSVQFFARRPSI